MFLGFALLDKVEFDKKALIEQINKDWGIDLGFSLENEDKNLIFAEYNDVKIGISLIPSSIPNGEAMLRAKRNVSWDKAITIAENHKAHLVVHTDSKADRIAEAKLFVKVMASVGQLEAVKALDVAGTVLDPEFYATMAKKYDEVDALPLYNLVYFGMYSSDKDTISAYTIGMNLFNKPEMEIIKSKKGISNIHQLIFMIANHVIVNNITLGHLDEIKLTEKESIVVELNEGIALNKETVKIKY